MTDPFLAKLLKKQLGGHYLNKLRREEMTKLSSYLGPEIFTNKCFSWTGTRNGGAGVFAMRERKFNVRRLLYSNFVGPLVATQMLKHCPDEHCVTLSHLIKMKNNGSRTNKMVLKVCPSNLLVDFEN